MSSIFLILLGICLIFPNFGASELHTRAARSSSENSCSSKTTAATETDSVVGSSVGFPPLWRRSAFRPSKLLLKHYSSAYSSLNRSMFTDDEYDETAAGWMYFSRMARNTLSERKLTGPADWWDYLELKGIFAGSRDSSFFGMSNMDIVQGSVTYPHDGYRIVFFQPCLASGKSLGAILEKYAPSITALEGDQKKWKKLSSELHKALGTKTLVIAVKPLLATQ